MSGLPKRFRVGTKYVVEAHGEFVKRFVEFPDGRRIRLAKRKRKHWLPAESAASLVPDQTQGTAPEKVSAGGFSSEV